MKYLTLVSLAILASAAAVNTRADSPATPCTNCEAPAPATSNEQKTERTAPEHEHAHREMNRAERLEHYSQFRR
jgi:hypothetical protein